MSTGCWAFRWSRMKGLHDKRDWLIRSEILDAIKERGLRLSTYTFRRVVRTVEPRPVMRHGQYQYTAAHLAAAMAAAERKAQVRA